MNLQVPKVLAILWLVEDLLDFQEGLCLMELVGWSVEQLVGCSVRELG
jgi:hypothetical protein